MACKDNNLDLSHYITLFARTERGQDPSASATCDSMQLGKTRVSVEEHQCHCGQEGHCCATCKEKPAPRSAKVSLSSCPYRTRQNSMKQKQWRNTSRKALQQVHQSVKLFLLRLLYFSSLRRKIGIEVLYRLLRIKCYHCQVLVSSATGSPSARTTQKSTGTVFTKFDLRGAYNRIHICK